VEEGFFADLVVLDPATVDAAPVRTAFDLPGGAKRLLADPLGVVRVLVNGRPIVEDGTLLDARPGQLLRAGRDTANTGTRPVASEPSGRPA
jgi:N-acyl-D-aspartate/D-glutamate deacylase